MTLTLKVRENISYWKLTYSAEIPQKAGTVILPINNTYTVVTADLALRSNIFSQVTNTFLDITNPNFTEQQQFIGGAFYMFLNRSISGYKVTYDFIYDVAVGNNKFSTL